MGEVLSFSFGTGGADVCANCKKGSHDHGPGGKCLYLSTTYRQVTDQELADMIGALESSIKPKDNL